jgi:signal transduction histidine kinase
LLSILVYTSKITRPLKLLKDSAAKVARGDFKQRVTVKSNDEIGQLIDSFNTMVNDLDNIDKVRSDFVANVSHDLRTPITSVRGFLEGILDGTIPQEKSNYYLGIVRDEVVRMNSLVNNLLEMTKFEQGKQVFRFKSFNINEMIRKCIVKYEKLFLDKNLDVEVDFETDDEFVLADQDAIERVFTNLIHNAVKFTNDSGIISLGTKRVKDKVEVYVKDTGIGISKEDIGYIFDRFYKTDKSRGVDKTGTGLGLSICKSILNAHDQDLYVESQLGKGSKFTFTLNGM